MWSFNRQDLRGRIAALAMAGGLALSLGGCFQPMYGGLAGEQLQDDLAAIKVEPVPERLGHYLGNELIFALNGTGSTVVPKYRLVITARERVSSPLVDTVTARATAGTVLVDAEYKLYSVTDDQKPVLEGVAVAAQSYDRTSQRFANQRAARDAEIRNAKVIADQIRTRLAAGLARKA
ncbi:MAG TPA: LPS assembly lipoprotein LptE [Beijerinckiaceae bacterium]|jgi:LPS-assembly lipoprotein|nr:LPS assembly lipoprotein LptE [Beijerinckiaceae bacterium]